MPKESKCYGNWLHDFYFKRVFDDRVLEICARCHKKKSFKNSGSNLKYLKFHFKQALQPSNKFFLREYGTTN